jgi:hypothetical protein
VTGVQTCALPIYDYGAWLILNKILLRAESSDSYWENSKQKHCHGAKNKLIQDELKPQP